jgi:hypothetical protein
MYSQRLHPHPQFFGDLSESNLISGNGQNGLAILSTPSMIGILTDPPDRLIEPR